MSLEIEAKMRLTDRDALIETLGRVGGVFVAELAETNSYFDSPTGGLKSTDQGLRIRVEVAQPGTPEESVTTTITHKGPRAHGTLKSREETELDVDNAKDAALLLGAIGYHHVLTFEKRRTRYTLDGCRIELDDLPVIGGFVEIEGPSDTLVLAAREKLGLDDAPLIKSSYIAMLKTHLHEVGQDTDTIRFENGKSVVRG